MRLERLEIQGFKSFKDRTIISFDDGVTGIVGPNGCGKSNIVDALFWVMGEQSAKHLRGTKMSDLIFSGSSKYAPSSFAEVTLSLHNTDSKMIHIGSKVVAPQEIHLTRKLYRNGETEYRINGEPARLKDIQEVFLDTGAGAKSYSIIAQGEIDRLVKAKPDERRTMIEEVAGITKFKLRKKESLRKIEQTTANLERLGDLEKEVYKQLKNLEKQAEKANKAKALKEKISRYELIVASHKERDYLESFAKHWTNFQQSQLEIEAKDAQKTTLELSLEEERIQKDELVNEINSLQSSFNEDAKLLAASEERLNSLEKTLEDKQDYLEEKSADVNKLQELIAARQERLKEVEKESQEHEQMAQSSTDFSLLEQQCDEKKEIVQEKELQVSNLRKSLEEKDHDMRSLDQDIYKNESKLSEASTTLQEIAHEMETLEEESSYYSDKLVERRDQLRALDKEIEILKSQKLEWEQERDKLNLQKNEISQSYRDLQKRVLNAQGQLETLESVIFSEVKKHHTKELLEKQSEFFLLGEKVQVQQDYLVAVNRLLGDALNYAISDCDEKISLLSSWKGNSEKNFDILVASATLNQNLDEKVPVDFAQGVTAKPISQVSNCESELAKQALSHYLVLETTSLQVSDIDNIIKGLEDAQCLGAVTVDGSIAFRKIGQLWHVDFFEDSSETDLESGVIAQNRKIQDLKQQLSLDEQQYRNQELLLSETEERISKINHDIQNAAQELSDKCIRQASIRSELETQEKSLVSGNTRLAILKEKKQNTSHARLDYLEMEETLSDRRDQIDEEIREIKEKILEFEEHLKDVNADYQLLRDDLNQKKAVIQNFEKQQQSYQSQMRDLQGQVEQYQEQITIAEDAKAQTLAVIEELKDAITQLQENNSQQAEQLSTKEKHLTDIKDNLEELLVGMQHRENEEKKLREIISRNEKILMESELKTGQIKEEEDLLVRNIFDEFRVDLRSSLAKYLELSTDVMSELVDHSSMFMMETDEGQVEIAVQQYQFEKKFPAQLNEIKEKLKKSKQELNRLGEVNWQAMEDYQIQQKRHDFLVEQAGELKKSIDDLNQAISHIDEKSRIRFDEAFREVNERFTKVFPIIFGGGAARLDLVPVAKSDEYGVEIIAQPPGKKMQSINLMSGGEKAMTAVSLIFSIFLVKPSPFCLLDEVDAPLDDANVGRFNELLKEMSTESQFIIITHNKKTMELNDMLYGVTMQDPGVSKAISVQLH